MEKRYEILSHDVNYFLGFLFIKISSKRMLEFCVIWLYFYLKFEYFLILKEISFQIKKANIEHYQKIMKFTWTSVQKAWIWAL